MYNLGWVGTERGCRPLNDPEREQLDDQGEEDWGENGSERCPGEETG